MADPKCRRAEQIDLRWMVGTLLLMVWRPAIDTVDMKARASAAGAVVACTPTRCPDRIEATDESTWVFWLWLRVGIPVFSFAMGWLWQWRSRVLARSMVRGAQAGLDDPAVGSRRRTAETDDSTRRFDGEP